MKRLLALSILFSSIIYGQAQENTPPKLVVGIVVDQMRAEYLYRFSENYGQSGFKRILNEGFTVKNMHYNYIPTATAPGHASIYTGTTPYKHGIVGNQWYDRKSNKGMYCAADSLVNLVGEKEKGDWYQRSPRNLISATVTDQLKMQSPQSKVIGISLKDRGAIFPAGHIANGAYWYHSKSGKFISSTFYRDQLPSWLKQFNQRKLADSLLNTQWDYLIDSKKYTHSAADQQDFEKIFNGKKTSSFPYDLKELRKTNGNFGLISQIPHGNTLLNQLALATIKNEQMGKGEHTDFLCISYSSTDYVGHNFGIRSKEIEDTYIRLDREIALLLNYLDQEVGQGNYLLFLTADHAASDVPPFLQEHQLEAGFIESKLIKNKINLLLEEKFGKQEYILYMDKTQLYLHEKVRNQEEILSFLHQVLMQEVEGIKEVYIPNMKNHPWMQEDIKKIFLNSYNRELSGDVLLHFKAGWIGKISNGTTHGHAYNSDTHVPLLWYGKGIKKGESVKAYTIDQIAPSLSFLLNIPLAETSNKKPILELFKK